MKKITNLLFIFLAVLSMTIFAFGQKEEAGKCFVVLEVEFLKTGKVGNVSVFSNTCDKDSGLEKKAVEAVKKVKFKPKKENGKSVDVIKKVEYSFEVTDGKSEDKISTTEGIIILDKPRAGYPKSDGGTICVTGTVNLRILFLATGEIGEIIVIKGLPYGLTEKAIEAANQIKFIPAKINGVPISASKTVQFNFNIY